jgi:hypothetical protein
VRREIPEEEFRRWFGATSYASDSGDSITVWVPTEGIRRTMAQFLDPIDRALAEIDRADTHVRFVVSGTGDEDDED